MAKKIKVRMTDQKNAFYLGSHVYRPGDIFEIEERYFRSDFMVKVVEPKKPAKPKVVEEPKEPEPTETVSSEAVAATVAPKVQKRKKT